MQRLLVLGGGTAGTMAANRLRRKLPAGEWQVLVVDRDDLHVYQPGQLFVPFGGVRPGRLVRHRRRFLRPDVGLVYGDVDVVEPDASRVRLVGGRVLDYDYLVVATGTSPRPDQTPGLPEAMAAGSAHEFYTLPGAVALRDALAGWPGGRLAVHVVDVPVKCPVAPLEFAFLAEAWARRTGMRDRVELAYVTPLPGAFTRPVASAHLGGMLDERKIHLEPDFLVESVDPDARALVSYDGRRVEYDLLVTVPLNMGSDLVARSGLGDELNYVPVDRGTLLSAAHGNVFAVGDASNIPTSKAGSVAHFSVELLAENFLDHVHGRPMTRLFDGHANCFVESGDGRALLVDFSYDVEPLPGTYPLPGLGPLSLLKETRTNHLAKSAFEWAYWHVLLPGRPLPVPALLSMAGKKTDAPA